MLKGPRSRCLCSKPTMADAMTFPVLRCGAGRVATCRGPRPLVCCYARGRRARAPPLPPTPVFAVFAVRLPWAGLGGCSSRTGQTASHRVVAARVCLGPGARRRSSTQRPCMFTPGCLLAVVASCNNARRPRVNEIVSCSEELRVPITAKDLKEPQVRRALAPRAQVVWLAVGQVS